MVSPYSIQDESKREKMKKKTKNFTVLIMETTISIIRLITFDIFSSRLADGAIPQCCGPQRPGGRLSCPSPVVRSPCRETRTAVSGASPGPPLSPVSLHKQAETQNIKTLDKHTELSLCLLKSEYLNWKNQNTAQQDLLHQNGITKNGL